MVTSRRTRVTRLLQDPAPGLVRSVVVDVDRLARHPHFRSSDLARRVDDLAALGVEVVLLPAGGVRGPRGGPQSAVVRAEPEAVLVLDEEDPGEVLSLLEQLVAAHSSFPEPVPDPSWLLEVAGVDPERERDVESWMTVGNGRTGTRGSLEEAPPGSFPAAYVAGIFGWEEPGPGPELGPELVRGPEWVRLDPTAGRTRVSLSAGECLEHRRVLDLRQGILFRQWRQRLSGGEWRFRSARLASLADREILALEAEAGVSDPEGNGDGSVSLGGEIPADHQEVLERAESYDVDSRRFISLHPRGGSPVTFAVATREEAGRLVRLATVGRATPGSGEATARQVAGRSLTGAERAGLAEVRGRHRAEWRSRWRDADVVVEGDPEAQRALRFCLYHLISSADPESDMASVGARGLTGPGYRGHVFWDTEVFVHPFFVWTHPQTARALLAYRYRTLPAARAKAAAFGCSGALYAWESADTGEDVTPPLAWLKDGTAIPVRTGEEEHHISADVAWAAWRYWQVSGDTDFLVGMGAEMIVETARFWASRATPGDDGRYHIRQVIGPDEYHETVDDNAFTNVMARWNLRTAIDLSRLLPALDADGWSTLATRLDLDPGEEQEWATVADGLVDNFDRGTLLYEQFAGFYDYENVLAADVADRPFTGEKVLGTERLHRSQVIKQADVVMLVHMLPELVPPDVARANYRHYEPRTSHGSSLSPAIHAAVAARLGALDDALHYFRLAAGIDLDDRMGNAADGCHLATMGGLWQAAAAGFGGVRPDGDVLRFDPRLPDAWDRLSFPVRWRGTRVELEATREELLLHAGGRATVAVGSGAPEKLESGTYRARRSGHDWGGLERVTG